MSSPAYPRLSVSVTVFTAFDHQHPLIPSYSQLSFSPDESERFGMALWVVTRKGNELQSYQNDPGDLRLLPSSLVRMDESLRGTAQRILREELGIEKTLRLRQSRIFDAVDTHIDNRVISVNFWAFVALEDLGPVLGGRDQVALEMVSSIEYLNTWMKRNNVEDYEGVSRFGFRYGNAHPQAQQKLLPRDITGRPILGDLGDDMVFYAWRDMRYGFTGKFEPFRFIGAHPLGETFRLSELKDLFEIVRGYPLQADQFRRMATGTGAFVEPAGSIDSSGSRPGKPAGLFRAIRTSRRR
jgi:ADP-ribose pyrophosphatase YjhB (NUDIX family)